MKKEIRKIHRSLYQLQPFLLGGVVSIIFYQAITLGGYAFYYVLLAFVLGLLTASYFYDKKMSELYYALERMEEMSKKSFEAVSHLLHDLQKHADIDIDVVTNDKDLDAIIKSAKKKGGDEDGKVTN